MQIKTIIIVLIGTGVLGATYFFIQSRAVPFSESPTATSTSENMSGTGTTTTQKPRRDFSKIPPHDIPEGAAIIDDYFYTYNNGVYLNSISGTSSLTIPDAKAGTFKRLTSFRSVPNPAVALDCNKAGDYAFYGDSSQVYFYQIWLNTEFRRSKYETLIGVTPEGFEVLSPSSFKGEPGTYTIGLEVGTSTCQYTINLQS